jgi:PAS domain-containing protein
MAESTAWLTVVYLAAALIGALTAAAVWRRREAPGGAAIAGMLAAVAIWALCDAIEVHLSTVEGKRLSSQFQYFGVVSAAPFFFHVSLALSGRRRPLSPAALAAVWGIPLATIGVAWSSHWHTWLWQSITLEPGSVFAVYHYGWWFWLLTAQNYALLAIGTTVLLRASVQVARPFRAPLLVVVISVLLPWLGNVAYVFKLSPWPGLNWFSISITISGLLLAWVVLREGLLDLLPRAREALVGLMADGVVVLDRDGAVLFANRAAIDILAIQDGPVRLPEALRTAGASDELRSRELEVEVGGTRKWIDVRSDAVRDRWGETAGCLLVVRDVTARKALETERENLIVDLQNALHTVRTLEDLLPICANCRNVRDDEGYWRRIDEYLYSRAGMQFTHGLCPACADELYGEYLRADAARGDAQEPTS